MAYVVFWIQLISARVTGVVLMSSAELPCVSHICWVFSRLEKAGMIKEPWLAQFCIIDFLTLIEDFL